MVYLEISGLILFIVLMTLGYRKNNRNMMLISALCLLVGLAGPDFVSGFIEGFNASKQAA
ncbi:hypothetical protein [uncultured Alteromonas sp.]|jgi:hypothetical protein|uniref:hypothetical protein n=1 Tax=uncultured Alteromonas sp. TaxID=179113 RepID=UPI0025E8601B|nr:hypothetical protein [uncultured Alteromonas sp.]